MFIPHIGRKKFSVGQQLYGRNMLISEYLRLTNCDQRGRKQVSSHIQVLKNIFKYHKYCTLKAVATCWPRQNVCFFGGVSA